MSDEKPSVSERYGRAIRSSHLEVEADEIGDIDKIIAAGWVRDTDGWKVSLGPKLMRLQAEVDSIRKKAHNPANHNASEIRFMVGELKSLRECSLLLGQFSIEFAEKRRFSRPEHAILKIATGCLNMFLDPNCHYCEGRGSNGEFGKPQITCKVCRGSKRKQGMGCKDLIDESFSRDLLEAMNAICGTAAGQMKRFQKN